MNTSKMRSCISLPPIIKEEEHQNIQPTKKKFPSISRRKQLKFDSTKELKSEIRYKGSFSITKLLPKHQSPKACLSMQLPKHIESRVDVTDCDYYPANINLSMYNIEKELKQVKSYPDNISPEYIKESFSQITQFSSKNSRHELSPKDLLAIPNRKLNLPQDLEIKYQTDPNLKIKSDKGESFVQICDIDTMITKHYSKIQSENGFLLINGCKNLNLEHEFGAVCGRNFEVSITKGGKCENYFVSFNKFSNEIEEGVMRKIYIYRDVQKGQSSQKLKLPKISEVSIERKKENRSGFLNPVTEAMVKFRDKVRGFNPESYLAKLSLFETHAYMRKKYSKNMNSC